MDNRLAAPSSPLRIPPPPPPQKHDTAALAPGFRFHPTDEELVCYYLKRKIFNRPVRFDAIAELDIYKHEPSALAAFSKLKSRDREFYFYSPLDKKYGNGGRMNRATGSGYWKATGKDREVRRDNQILGMKKTLVFHTGRAPDGVRTNWVMHEYRLIDAEFQRLGAALDAYVLCRVFHKNNIGPPIGNRYAPFIEEEWDVDQPIVVPGVDAIDDVAPRADDMDNNKSNDEQLQGTLSIDKVPGSLNDEPLRETREFIPIQKTETDEDCEPPVYLFNTNLIQYKRRKLNEAGPSRSNKSDCSAWTRTQDLGSSTTTESSAISALLEFSLMMPHEHKKRSPPQVPTPTTNLNSTIPPSIMKLITDLQTEVHKVSKERETLKLEMMSAHAMINMLQSQIVELSKKN